MKHGKILKNTVKKYKKTKTLKRKNSKKNTKKHKTIYKMVGGGQWGDFKREALDSIAELNKLTTIPGFTASTKIYTDAINAISPDAENAVRNIGMQMLNYSQQLIDEFKINPGDGGSLYERKVKQIELINDMTAMCFYNYTNKAQEAILTSCTKGFNKIIPDTYVSAYLNSKVGPELTKKQYKPFLGPAKGLFGSALQKVTWAGLIPSTDVLSKYGHILVILLSNLPIPANLDYILTANDISVYENYTKLANSLGDFYADAHVPGFFEIGVKNGFSKLIPIPQHSTVGDLRKAFPWTTSPAAIDAVDEVLKHSPGLKVLFETHNKKQQAQQQQAQQQQAQQQQAQQQQAQQQQAQQQQAQQQQAQQNSISTSSATTSPLLSGLSLLDIAKNQSSSGATAAGNGSYTYKKDGFIISIPGAIAGANAGDGDAGTSFAPDTKNVFEQVNLHQFNGSEEYQQDYKKPEPHNPFG